MRLVTAALTLTLNPALGFTLTLTFALASPLTLTPGAAGADPHPRLCVVALSYDVLLPALTLTLSLSPQGNPGGVGDMQNQIRQGLMEGNKQL